ncbi:hypothetical protein ACFO4P_16890 [Epilithonimonas pallida]|uniref:Uncharacterized protein n=1 Tax=Epilithonimonas pallida TaxID=373671 RepID=A0ABY1R4D1_9FLAO|nr:hypothetical protein SAMN05421679_10663 [Epilithonimonas pallida]
MTNVNKIKTTRNIDSDIEKMWEVIDEYLPANYTQEVIRKIPLVKPSNVRMVKRNRKGKIAIIRAMYDVAVETKKLLNP